MQISDIKNEIFLSLPTWKKDFDDYISKFEDYSKAFHLSDFDIKISNPSQSGLDVTNKEIQKIQGLRTSLLGRQEYIDKLFLQINIVYANLKDSIDILKAYHINDTKLLKSDKAINIYLLSMYPEFFKFYSKVEIDINRIKTFNTLLTRRAELLEDASKAVSRQIAAIQLQTQSGEISRKRS
jgi:hypothetical protein